MKDVLPDKKYELRQMCRHLNDAVRDYYADPAHEAEFREWYKNRYGREYQKEVNTT